MTSSRGRLLRLEKLAQARPPAADLPPQTAEQIRADLAQYADAIDALRRGELGVPPGEAPRDTSSPEYREDVDQFLWRVVEQVLAEEN